MTIKKIFKKTNFRGGLRSCSSRIRGRVFRAFGKCTIFSENKRRRSFPAWEMCRFFPSVRCVCVLRAVCSACSDISVTENSFTKLFDWEFFGRSFLRAFSFFLAVIYLIHLNSGQFFDFFDRPGFDFLEGGFFWILMFHVFFLDFTFLLILRVVYIIICIYFFVSYKIQM